ncbi:hypothetical protein QTP88_002514 [Uroleucon formosanum]
MDHIESFNPTISHYRREHAPNVRYLPSDVTISLMHQHFIEKFPESDRNYISYEYYRCKVKEKNISFAQLGHEECELCESFNFHEHKSKILPECDVCTIYTTHINKTKKARDLYKKQANTEFDEKNIFLSVDLQKVELSLKHQKKTYDFDDFAIAVGNANKSKVVVKKMEHSDFFLWKDYKAQQKLTKSTNRILLKDVVSVQVKRGKFILYIKRNYDEEYSEFNFLKKSVMKINGMPHPISLTKPRGILQEKRDSILQNLSQVLPANRKIFWENIPTC